MQFRVIGSDPLELRRIAYRVRDILRANPDGIDPNLDWNERMPSLRLEVDQDRARAVGLTPADIAAALQTLLNGFTVTTMLQGTERIDVVARAILPERRGLASLADLTIAVRDGVAIPLGQVARIVNRAEDAILWRRNRETVITVRADVLDGVQAPDVSNAVWPALAALRAELTPGYRIEMGGAIEESAKANRSIYALLPLMLLVTAGLLMVQLQSFSLLFLAYSNAIVLNTGTTGTLTIGNTGTAISTIFSGGVTGTNNLVINEGGTTGTITFSTVAINNTGTITNTGSGSGTTTISAGVGSNVTSITENSTTSALTISGSLTVNSGGTTLTNSNASGSSLLTVSGGVTGTGALVLNNNSGIANGITLSTSSVNNTGTITNSGSGSGVSLISAGVGSNVTGVTQNSATSALLLSGTNTYTGGG